MRGPWIDPYMFVGLRGRISLDGWARRQWSEGTPEEDAFSLIAKWSELLGVASFADDRYVIEHWGHCDAGGTWTEDGAEHLLAWLQMDLRTRHRHPEVSVNDPRRALPTHLATQVLEAILRRVGEVAISEVSAVLPLARVSPDLQGRVVSGRDWLTMEGEQTARRRIVVHLDVAPSHGAYPTDRLVETMQTLGGDRLGTMALRSAEGRSVARRETDEEPPPLWQLERGGVEFECSAPAWNVVLGAWFIELVAWACSAASVGGIATIAVRPVES